ncbi:MAG: glycosyltransferase family 4 protein [Saprospiraceae bacterium]|nr:glycosyltransferase family 4 protein [Saprospiraceae bacterium]
MSVLYIHTAPTPKITGTDAVFNEAASLVTRFGGEQISLFPFSTPMSVFPRMLYGWHKLPILRQRQQMIDFNHIFAPGLYYYPVLSQLSKPIIYSVTAAVSPADLSRPLENLKQLPQILVSNDRDAQVLSECAFNNVTVVKPGLDLSRFRVSELALEDTLHLLMASAPWELSQFSTKGVNLLLDVLLQHPKLRLTLLWRGYLLKEIEKNIRDRKLEDRIHLINEHVDVATILPEVHATILLAKNADLVKAYPHSLIESLACGKPVIISNSIAMADYVQDKQCGVVVSDYSLDSLRKSLDLLKRNYAIYAKNAQVSGAEEFDKKRMFKEVDLIYQKYGFKASS